MSENSKFWLTIIIAAIGALSWIPQIIELLKPNKISGKIISQYFNFTADHNNILILYKLSVVSMNKDYFLKDINLKIKFESSEVLTSISRNNRLTVFTFERPKKLLVPNNEFLNNLSIFPKNKAVVGYLFFSVPHSNEENIKTVEFEFLSQQKGIKTLKFSSADIIKEKLLFDDTIWSDLNPDSTSQYHYQATI